jgi:hypothetical protein
MFAGCPVHHGFVPCHQNARFEVTVVLPRPYGDQVTRAVLQDAHHVVRLPDNPRDIVAARDIIASKGFDVLLVADDGIDPFIYTLLHARVAPIQVRFASWLLRLERHCFETRVCSCVMADGVHERWRITHTIARQRRHSRLLLDWCGP